MTKPESLTKWITIGLQVVLVAGLILSAVQQHWMNAVLTLAVIILTALPGMMERQFKVTIPAEFELLAILFIFASIFLGEVRGYYLRFWWWDVFLHTGSGLLLGLVAFLLVYVLNQLDRIDLHLKPGFVALFSFTFAMAVGSLWEILEYAADVNLGLNMQKSGLRDTMWDLIVDAIGAIVFAAAGYFYMRRGWGSPIFRSVETFVRSNPEMFDDPPEIAGSSRAEEPPEEGRLEPEGSNRLE